MTHFLRYDEDVQLDQQRESDQANVANFPPCNLNRKIFHDTDQKPAFNFSFCCGEDFRRKRSLFVIPLHYTIILILVIFPSTFLVLRESRFASGVPALLPTYLIHILLAQNNEQAN